MRNRKVELDAKRSPRASIAYLRFLDRWIGVEHRLAADLVDAGIYGPSNIRQHSALDIFVLKKPRPPCVFCLLPRQVLSQRVRITELCSRISIKRRVGV